MTENLNLDTAFAPIRAKVKTHIFLAILPDMKEFIIYSLRI